MRLLDLEFDYAADIQEVVVKDIAIIGLAVKLPKADDPDTFWNHVCNKEDLIDKFPQEREQALHRLLNRHFQEEEGLSFTEGGYLKEIDKFDHAFFQISPKEASLMDPNQRLFLETAWSAIEHAGYGGGKMAGTKTGIFLGFCPNQISNYLRIAHEIGLGHEESLSISNMNSVIASRIAYLLDLRGPTITVDTSCSSSLVAVHLACQAIRNGDCEQALVGSSNLMLLPMKSNVKLGIESSDGRTRSFDEDSDGTGSGEGVVAILLKPLQKALRDRDQIHAVIKGSAVNQDGKSIGLSAPNVRAQEEVLVKAWEEAGVNPETITYIEAHGTGTRLGDPIEIEGIQRAFGRYTNMQHFCAVSSVKSNIGHLDAAAGLAGMIKAVLALKNKKIPPTVHYQTPNRKLNLADSPIYINNALLPWETNGIPRRCGVSAFGMSGTNCHVILEEAPLSHQEQTLSDSEMYHIFTLSAKSESALKQLIVSYTEWLDSPSCKSVALKDICYTQNTGRGHYSYRIALVVHSIEELQSMLNKLCGSDNMSSIQLPNYFYKHHEVISMKRSVAFNHQITLDSLEEMNRVANEVIRLSSTVSPKALQHLEKLCELYIQGAEIEWENLYMDQLTRKISVPSYPFDRVSCWLDAPEETKESSKSENVQITGRDTGEYSPAEIKIARSWMNALGLQQIDILDDFYDLGGDSILAVQVISDLQIDFHIQMNDLFSYSTVKELAENIPMLENALEQKIESLRSVEVVDADQPEDESEIAKLEQYRQGNQVFETKFQFTRKDYGHIMLTGVTGFLGMHLLYDLLLHTDAVLYLPVRGEDDRDAELRVIDKMNYYFDYTLFEQYKSRIQIYKADLAKPQLGISEPLFHELRQKVDCILHCAGLAKHYGHYEEFYTSNVQATENIIDFAQSGIRKDVHYMSTMAIAYGNITNKEFVYFTEDDLDMGQQSENYYVISKFEAEKKLAEAKDSGLYVNIYRIGNVICHSETGVFQPNIEDNGIYNVLKGFIKLGIIPKSDIKNFELSFVNDVSGAIVSLFDRIELLGQTFHIYNPKQVSTSEIASLIRRSNMGLNPLEIDSEDYFEKMLEWFQQKDHVHQQNLAQHQLLHFGLLDTEKRETKQQFIAERTLILLAKNNFAWTNMGESHMQKLLKFCYISKFY